MQERFSNPIAAEKPLLYIHQAKPNESPVIPNPALNLFHGLRWDLFFEPTNHLL
jgi:hypothetical protein